MSLANQPARRRYIWDAHAGFLADPHADLSNLSIWKDAGVDFLSVSVGFDVIPPERTMATIAAFRHWLNAHADEYMLVERSSDLVTARESGRMAIAFDIEGMAALGGRLEMVELFHRLGVRQMLVAYNLNNAAGGGCHDDEVGLTDFGRAVIDEMNRVGMAVDLSHCSYRTGMEAMERSTAPVIFSHSNARALVRHDRNITDEQIRACAATGGVVGAVGLDFFLGLGAPAIEKLADQIEYLIGVAGPEHVGLGLDYGFPVDPVDFDLTAVQSLYWPEAHYPRLDGDLMTRRDYVSPARIRELADELSRRGNDDGTIRGVLGDNFLRVMTSIW